MSKDGLRKSVTANWSSLYPYLYETGARVLERYPGKSVDDALSDYFSGNSLVAYCAEHDLTQIVILSVATEWVAQAMPVVDTSMEVASAFCVSGAQDVNEEDLHFPWRAFAIRVPTGLISAMGSDGTPKDVHTIVARVWVRDNGKEAVEFVAFTETVILHQFGLSKAHIFGEDVFLDTPASALPTTTWDHRAMTLCRGMIRGVLAFFSSSPKESFRRPRSTKAKTLKGRPAALRKMPDFDHYVITADVKVNARDAVRAYNRGERAKLALRSLVRGHFRSQACGPRRESRQIRWILPYWRGLDNSITATRTHKV
jgi:hypothetical protein